MAVSQLHTLYAVVHDSTAIPGVTRLNIDPQDQISAEATGGEAFTRFAALVGQDPITGFDCLGIATALGLVGLTGDNIADLANKLTLYAYKMAEGGVRAGAGAHRKMVINDGLIIPQRLSVPHRGNATLTYQILITYDGSNDPIVLTESQSVPTAPSDVERFGLGPVSFGGVTLAQIRQFDIDFGITAVAESADGDLWPTTASIQTILPKVTLRGIDPTWFAAAGVPLAGKTGAHANSILYLRKRNQTGYVANGTAEHIKFTVDGLAHLVPLFDARGSTPAETGVVIECEYDGSNNPITIDPASAIT